MAKDKQFWTQKNRSTVVTKTRLTSLNAGNLPVPRASSEDFYSGREWLKEAVEAQTDVWKLTVSMQTGFDPEFEDSTLFRTEAEALAQEKSHPVGSEIEPFDFLRPSDTLFNAEKLSIETEISVLGRGEPPYGLIYEALEGAGLFENFNLSPLVLEWVGIAGAASLEERFGENWTCVALLEYCVRHFHPSSLATLAARVYVADFVSDYDYDTGFASRELMMLHGGAEAEALKSRYVSQKAGQGGGRAARARRQKNLEALLQEIERLADAVGIFSEDRIVEQAIETAAEKYSTMPKTQSTLDDYLTTLRSEEPFRSRYNTVFQKIA